MFGGFGQTSVHFKSNSLLEAAGITSTGSGSNETGFGGGYTLLSYGNLYGLTTLTGAMGTTNISNTVLTSTGKYDTIGLVGGAVIGVYLPIWSSGDDEASSKLALDLRAGGSYSFNVGAAYADSIGSQVNDTHMQAGVGTAAAKLIYSFNTPLTRFSPFAQFGYNRRLQYDNAVQVNNTVYTYAHSRDSYYAAAGVEFSITEKIHLNLSGRGEQSTDQTIYSGALGVKIILN